MADEEFYLQVENELKEGTKDEALWSKAKHLAKDDEKETEIQYTKLKVAQLKLDSTKSIGKKMVGPIIWGLIIIFILIILVDGLSQPY